MTKRITIAKAPAEGEFISVREAAGITKLSEVSIRRFLTRKTLRRYKVGARTLVRASEVLGLIREA
jgi:excisionase family DNA binding protein